MPQWVDNGDPGCLLAARNSATLPSIAVRLPNHSSALAESTRFNFAPPYMPRKSECQFMDRFFWRGGERGGERARLRVFQSTEAPCADRWAMCFEAHREDCVAAGEPTLTQRSRRGHLVHFRLGLHERVGSAESQPWLTPGLHGERLITLVATKCLISWRARRDCSRLRRSSSASLRTAAATRQRPTWPKDGQVVELALSFCREFELKRRTAGVGRRSQIR